MDGLSGAGAVFDLAGTGLSMYGGTLAQSAMEQALQNELTRQRNYGMLGQGYLNKMIGAMGTEGTQKERQAGTQAAMQRYQNAPNLLAPSGMSSTANLGMMTPQAGAEIRRGQQVGAGLQGLTEADVKQSIEGLKRKTQIALNNLNAQRSAAVLPYEIGAASHNNWMDIGSILSSVGGALGAAGATSGSTTSQQASPTVGALPTSNQMTALNIGQGPVTSAYANRYLQMPNGLLGF